MDTWKVYFELIIEIVFHPNCDENTILIWALISYPEFYSITMILISLLCKDTVRISLMLEVYVTGFVALMDLYKRDFCNTTILSTLLSLDDTTGSSIENTFGISSF